MSRFEESKILEHDGRLDQISSELNTLRKEKEEPEKEMTKVRVVAVEFQKKNTDWVKLRSTEISLMGLLYRRSFRQNPVS